MEDNFAIKKILVSLNLSEMDEVLIRLSSYTARRMGSDRVYFIHVTKEQDMPKELRKQLGDEFALGGKGSEHKIREQVEQFFEPAPDSEIIVEVHEGIPTDRLLKLAHKYDVDLLVIGKKGGIHGNGAVAEKVLKAANRSVLLVPELLPSKMDKVLVPVDFSKHSLRALKQAIKIQENSEIPLQVKCQHVYELPSGWHTSGKSEKEFADIMCQHAREGYKKFLSQLPEQYRAIPCAFTLDNSHDPVNEIYEQAVKEQADLIVMGSKGKSAAAAALMGSVADRLATRNNSIPLLIVKDKNENIGFLTALLNL